ncbi:MAG: PrsW family intramembrane metalloprotease [Deltaproteobacteria bacterium]|nr:PrsW family intramembrane metalloprotease [Deltaproteobacteria bacterium]
MSGTDTFIIYLYSYFPAIMLGAFFWWLDRIERESFFLVVFAFLWGAFGAGLLSFFWNTFFHIALEIYQKDNATVNDVLGGVVVAPFVEELTKGVLILVLLKLKKINNVTDGILMGVIIGLGFAASENVHYAKEVIYPRSGELAMWHNLWFREIHTTLLHASATAVWGALIGYSRNSKGLMTWFNLANGFVLAVMTHAFWNLMANYAGSVQGGVDLVSLVMRFELFVIFGMLLAMFLAPLKKQGEIVVFVCVGIVFFIVIIVSTILIYRVFIKERVKGSPEYQTASYFIMNSESLKEQLLDDVATLEFDDLHVSEKKSHGICEITFEITLKNGLTEELMMGLVKVADFWVVYEVLISPGSPAAYYLTSSYQKIIMFLDRLGYQDIKTARLMLDVIKQEIADPDLLDYLTARLNALGGHQAEALKTLQTLEDRVFYTRLAVIYEKAMIYFSEEKFKEAAAEFNRVIKLYGEAKANGDFESIEGGFSDLPKDPLIASFNHDNILADTYQNLALSSYHTEDHMLALKMADKAIAHAQEIQSKVVKSSSVFIKGLALYKLKRFADAEHVFRAVTQDLDNTNLSQKAWAYFYMAEIASQFSRYEDSLDYYETAVNLDPFNYLIRRETIEYLMNRNLVGDLEIALGMALRGIQYDVEVPYFKDRAAQIFQRLGMPDKSGAID